MTAPTSREYADADRLLRDVMVKSAGVDQRGFFQAAGLCCWIEATKPAAAEPERGERRRFMPLPTWYFVAAVAVMGVVLAILARTT